MSPNRSNPPEFTLSLADLHGPRPGFLVVGGASLFAPLFPLRIGVIEWEFGTASEFFDNVPIFGLGLGFLMAAGLAAGARGGFGPSRWCVFFLHS